MSDDPLKRQATALQSLAEAAYWQADEQLGAGNWSRLVFDYRFASDGDQALWQFRALTPAGMKYLSSRRIGDAPHELHCLRRELPGEPWFGLCLILRSDGKAHVKYDDNPHRLDGILEDARFYEELL